MRPRILEQDRETSAILVNRSQHGIAAIQQLWTFEHENGRTSSILSGGSTPVLLPFGIREKLLALYRYWHVIFPGSKRYLTANGNPVGDNSDMRPPEPDEIWPGGIASGCAGRGHSRGPLRKVTLTLDGVFFDDGGFAGPNREGLWDRTVLQADAHLRVAEIVRQRRDDGNSTEKIFAEIETVAGPMSAHPPPPPPPPPPAGMRTPETYRASTRRIRELALHRVAFLIARLRQGRGE
jgi:hypothetical protein